MNRLIALVVMALLLGGCAGVNPVQVQRITPKLGPRFGVAVWAEGTISGGDDPRTKAVDPFYFTINSIDNRALDTPINIEIWCSPAFWGRLSDLPPDKPIVVYGYETVFGSGIPECQYNDILWWQDTSYVVRDVFCILKCEFQNTDGRN